MKLQILNQKNPVASTSKYSVATGDFTTSQAGGSKVVTIAGLGLTIDARNIKEAFYYDATGVRREIPLTTVTVSGLAVTFADNQDNFKTTDVVEIIIEGPNKAGDLINNIVRVQETNSLDTKFTATSIIDTTNVAADTAYYPSATGSSMDNYKDLSFSGKFIDADGTVTLTIEATDDEDTTNADWIDVTELGLLDNNTSTNASITVTNGTITFAMKFDNFNFSYYRYKLVNDGATNTIIIKERKKTL